MPVPIDTDQIEWAGWVAAGFTLILGCIGLGKAGQKLTDCEARIEDLESIEVMTAKECGRRHEADLELRATHYDYMIKTLEDLANRQKSADEVNRQEHQDIMNHLMGTKTVTPVKIPGNPARIGTGHD